MFKPKIAITEHITKFFTQGRRYKMDEKRSERFLICTTPSVRKMIEKNYKSDNCRSRSEYVSKAVLYYSGQLASKENDQFISTKVASLLRSIINEKQNRIEHVVFKLAVELAVTMNVVAATSAVNPETIPKLRHVCIEELKKSKGLFEFEDAYDWQKNE